VRDHGELRVQPGQGGEGGPAAWQRTASAFAAAVDSGRLDLSLARLGEGHADAVAILAELGGPRAEPGSRWANPPGPNVTATRQGSGWLLHGVKQYCSGAQTCTDALVAAVADDGARLFAVATERLEPDPASWPATGMAASDTLDVGFPEIPAVAVGLPGGYTDRPGFSHGGVGVAACWYGGARAVVRTLLGAAAKRDVGRPALAHLSAVDLGLRAARAALDQAADEIDADPGDLRGDGPLRTVRVRSLTEVVATDVMARTGRALGSGPLGHDEAHSRAIADLIVYLRQHHGERELARLGERVAERGDTW
jgi:alkylation response protein AidB-like acyl-CoA dehydrogenase